LKTIKEKSFPNREAVPRPARYTITARNESPTGLLTLVYLESDFRDGLYPGFTFKTLTGRSGLEIGIQVKV